MIFSLVVLNICLVSLSASLDIVVVTCRENAIEAKFSKPIAISAGYAGRDLRSNDPSCVFDQEDDQYFIKNITPLNSCGNEISVNSTHFTYSNTIASSNERIPIWIDPFIRHRLIAISFQCFYKIDLQSKLGTNNNLTYGRLLNPDVNGEDIFHAAMDIFSDSTYRELYHSAVDTVPIFYSHDILHVGIALMGNDTDDVYILMRQCWTTLAKNPFSEKYMRLLENGCPSASMTGISKVNIISNGMAQHALWNGNAAGFANVTNKKHEFEKIWLHCGLSLCTKQTCEPTCSSSKPLQNVKWRDPHGVVSTGPFVVKSIEDAERQNRNSEHV